MMSMVWMMFFSRKRFYRCRVRSMGELWRFREISMKPTMPCRQCGACCIVPSISSPIPGMPGGKPAGVRCIHLTESHRCAIYERRPAVCAQFTPTAEFCGASFQEAVQLLSRAELMTRPGN